MSDWKNMLGWAIFLSILSIPAIICLIVWHWSKTARKAIESVGEIAGLGREVLGLFRNNKIKQSAELEPCPHGSHYGSCKICPPWRAAVSSAMKKPLCDCFGDETHLFEPPCSAFVDDFGRVCKTCAHYPECHRKVGD